MEQLSRYQSLMGTWEQVVTMTDLTHVERVVEDASYRGSGEETGFGYQLAGAIREPVDVPGAISLPVEPGGKLREGHPTAGITVE
ncbi:MAG: hypothetical protein IH860_05415 [Chloroflexi bacterium]|nr:hypothetical protein [Chloroflexota bacterium]